MAEDLVTIFLIGMVGVVVGGIITFLTQKSIQERAWRKERSDKVYAPLLDQLYEVEANLYKLKKDPSYQILSGIREKHLLHWVKPKLRDKLWRFEIELHNFNNSLQVAINTVKKPMNEEISQKIKEEHRDEVQRTTPFCNEFFWNELATLVLKREDSGGFFGDIGEMPMLERSYGELEKYFKTRTPFDDVIKKFASQIKGYPFFKRGDFKRKLKELVFRTQELRSEIEKEMGIKHEDWG